MLERLVWESEVVARLDDLVFRVDHVPVEDASLPDGYFALLKTREHLEEYARFWRSRPAFTPGHVIELGMWDGGSVAFWFELFRPRKHVGIDLAPDRDARYFERYVRTRRLGDRISAYWGTDASDRERLLEIVEREFDGPLDLVIDDASHVYGKTKASFEALFPLLRPGGLYVIEDWAWGHWEGLDRPHHPGVDDNALTRLVVELLGVLGTARGAVQSVDARKGFVAVERGEARLEPGEFALADHVHWSGSRISTLRWRVRRTLRAARRRVRRSRP